MPGAAQAEALAEVAVAGRERVVELGFQAAHLVELHADLDIGQHRGPGEGGLEAAEAGEWSLEARHHRRVVVGHEAGAQRQVGAQDQRVGEVGAAAHLQRGRQRHVELVAAAHGERQRAPARFLVARRVRVGEVEVDARPQTPPAQAL